MKIRRFLVTLCFCVAGMFSARAEQSISLQKFYAGVLYIGSVSESYAVSHTALPLVGVRGKFNFLSGSLNTRMLCSFDASSFGHFWYQKELGFIPINLNIGFLPRPIAMINKPEPVSADGHFMPPSKSAIPGAASGTMGRLSLKNFGNDLMFGLYQNKDNQLEYNFGTKQAINWFIIKTINFSGFKSDKKGDTGGLAINVELKKFSFMVFGQNDINSAKTYTFSSYLELPAKTGFYTSLVKSGMNKDLKWKQIELGLIKYFSDQLGPTKIDYMLGVVYSYSEVKPKTANIYLQTWFQR